MFQPADFLWLYVLINIIVFVLYGFDKVRAIKSGRRVSEKTLLVASLFGAIGGVLGMILFRHKTRKPKFKIVYVFFTLHMIVFIYAYINNIMLILSSTA